MNDYGPENNVGYRYILVVFDNFKECGWTIPLKNKYAQSTTDTFSQIVETSERKPNLLETDDGGEYVNKIFSQLLNKSNHEKISNILPSELLLQNDAIELYAISQRNRCLKKELLIGYLNYHLSINNILIQSTAQRKRLSFKLPRRQMRNILFQFSRSKS